MTKITELEGRVLNGIAHQEHNPRNGASPESASDVSTWAFTEDFAAIAECSVASAKGAMGSLTQKGLINCSGGGREATVSFTEAGFEAWKSWFEKSGLKRIG